MNIKDMTLELEDELVSMRRHFHMYPEVSWDEYNTQKEIMRCLDQIGVPYIKAVKTGVIATIKGKQSSDKTIGIRADIDALPVEELSGVKFQSKNKGCMHACGHDTHITILLGTAKILAKIKDELTVTVKLIFQPAEEFIEDSGAAYMKNEAEVLECDRLIALHIWSKIEAGYASLRYGPVMSAADTFDIHIKGKGGHGALPYQTIDPITAGCELVEAIQRLVSREISALEPAVISITSFNSGTTSNVIPGTAHLMGTARTFDDDLRNAYPQMLKRVAQGVAKSTRTSIEVDYHMGPPPMINSDECVDTGRKSGEKVFGKDHLIEHELQMGGEDFAKYENPKCLLLLGGGWPKESRQYPQHSPYFDINESVLKLGVEYFVQYVLEYQEEE